MNTPIKKLDLKRETVKSLKVTSSIRTGDDTTVHNSSGYGGGRPGSVKGASGDFVVVTDKLSESFGGIVKGNPSGAINIPVP